MNHFLMVLVECLNSRHFRINKLHSHLECFYILSGYLPAIHAAIAQWIERRIAVPKVGGSNPPGRTKGMAGGERMVAVHKVAGSTPAGRTS